MFLPVLENATTASTKPIMAALQQQPFSVMENAIIYDTKLMMAALQYQSFIVAREKGDQSVTTHYVSPFAGIQKDQTLPAART